MAWYDSHYVCPECSAVWDSEWSCGSDEECPECEARDISPVYRKELTVVVEPSGDGRWAIWRSPLDAEDNPGYEMVGHLKLSPSGILNLLPYIN
jgi:hypothetical protein